MKNFKEDNDALVNSFLKRTFFNRWRGNASDSGRLELEIDAVHNHSEIALANLSMVLDWLTKNKYKPEIEFFSREPFARKSDLQALRLIIDKFRKEGMKSKIAVSTDCAFLKDGERTEEVESLLKYSRKMKVPVILSISFEGKYCERNTQTKRSKDYDSYFVFSKKWGFEFYPIIHPRTVKKWGKNFLWFQEKLKKSGVPCWNIHLSEARNEKWSLSQIKDFANFVSFLTEWTYRNLCRNREKCFADAIFSKRGFNILSDPFFSGNRKPDHLSRPAVRVILDNLTFVPCRGMSRPPFAEAKFKVKNNRIVGVESRNPEMLIGRISSMNIAMPYCETCPLKYLCQKGCLDFQFKVTGDPFSPVPAICKLEYAKVCSFIRVLEKFNLFNIVYSRLDSDQKLSLNVIRESLSESRKNKRYEDKNGHQQNPIA